MFARKIVSAHESVIPISSSMSNAFIDFSTMDCSILALVSDVIVDGKPLAGYGFNSNGRYSAGEILRRRILPRIMEAPEGALLDENGELCPSKAWDLMMKNEKPGGHGERSVAVGVVDMALHDLAAKIAGVPLYCWISDHYGDGDPGDSVWVYGAGGYYAPGKTLTDLQDEMKRFLDAGYDVVKMKVGGAPLVEDPRRIEAVLEVLDGGGSRLVVDVNGKFDLDEALEFGRAVEPYGLFWYEEIGDPLDYGLNATVAEHYTHPIATGENLFSMQDARNLIRYGGMRPDRDWLQFDPALSYGLVEYRRTQAMLAQHGWSSRLHPPRRPPVLAGHRGRPAPGRQRVLPGRVPAHRWLRRRRRHRAQPHHARRPSRCRFRGQGQLLQGPARPARVRGTRCPHQPRRQRRRCAPRGGGRRRGAGLVRELWFQVIVGAVLVILVGWWFPTVGAAMSPLNDWFISLIKMIVVPVVFVVIVNGIASMDNLRAAGRIGVKSIVYFLVLSLVSMLIGLVVANVLRPGAGMNVDVASLSADGVPEAATQTHLAVVGFISGLIPKNLIGAFTDTKLLAALVASLLFGVALNETGETGRPLVAVVATTGAQSLRGLGYLILLFFATCAIYVLVVLGAIMKRCGLSLFGLMRFLRAELLIALSTCSSEAVLPQLITRLEELGVGRPVVGIVVPAGFSFNLDGSAVYLTMAFLFLAQATGAHLTLGQQLAAVAIMMLTSKGTAGIAGGAFIVLACTLSAIGMVPVGSLALVVGIDRILNEGRVFINVLGNAVAAIVVGKWENDFDHDRAAAILSGRHRPGEVVA